MKSVLSVYWKDCCWSWNSNTLATWWEELTHLKRPWCWERLKAGAKGSTEDEMVRYYHWLDGNEFEQAPGVGDGQGSLACCSPWGHKELDTTEWLNWTEELEIFSNILKTETLEHSLLLTTIYIFNSIDQAFYQIKYVVVVVVVV